MNRGYSREWYLDRIEAIKRILPNATISTDIITGFCGETEEQHQETISLIKEVEFSYAYMYTYSERPKTLAERKYEDDVPEKMKLKRLDEIIQIQRANSAKLMADCVGKTYSVLAEKLSKKSSDDLSGRNSQNSMVIFPKENYEIGQYVDVEILKSTSGTLIGKAVGLSKTV